MPGNNGWRSGDDPTLRALRVVGVSTLIALLVWWLVFDAVQDIFAGALLVGAILMALFGDITVAFPFLSTERRQRREDDEDDG
jgi:hypothetical protein